MFVVSGVSGKTGRATADALLAAGLPVRVIVRSADKGRPFAERGAEVAVADLGDVDALKSALDGATAAYLINPPAYGEADPFAIALRLADGFARAIEQSDLARAVVLSSISAHLSAGNGIIHSNHLIEQRLGGLAKPVTFLRPGYFMENWAHVMGPVLSDGVLPSMLDLDRPFPMVAVADIGALAAKLLTETWIGRRIVELEGPTRVTPVAVANALGEALGRPVKAIAVPREARAGILAASGMSERTASAFVEMYDAFNDGTIRYEGGQPRRGETRLAQSAAALAAAGAH